MDVVTYALLSGKVSGVESMVTSLAEGFAYKGSVSSVDNLPDDAAAGDLYTVGGKKYVWDGTNWVQVIDYELDDDLDTAGAAADAKAVGDALATKVPTTRTVNSKALSSDITLAAGDIGYDGTAAYSSGTVGNELTQLSTAINQELYEITTDASIWSQGYWAIADGIENSTSSTWIKTKGFLPENVAEVYDASNLLLYLQAWEKTSGNYIGTWNGTQWSTTYTSGTGLLKLNIVSFRENYPDYKFKITVTKTDSTSINPSTNGVQIFFAISNIDNITSEVSNMQTALNTIIVPSANLYNPSDPDIFNGRIGGSGAIILDNSLLTSGKIPILNGETVYCTRLNANSGLRAGWKLNYIYVYDSADNRLGDVIQGTTNQSTYTCDKTNAAYFRFTTDLIPPTLVDPMVAKSADAEYAPFGNQISENVLNRVVPEIVETELEEHIFGEDNVSFIKDSVNVFDKTSDGNQNNYRLNSEQPIDGQTTRNDANYISHIIPCKNGDVIRLNMGFNLIFGFKADGTYSRGYAGSSFPTNTVTIDREDVTQIRIDFVKADMPDDWLQSLMVTVNNEMPSIYEEYDTTFLTNDITLNTTQTNEVKNIIDYHIGVGADILKGKVLATAGDSITYGIRADVDEETGYSKTYGGLVALRHGMTFLNYGVSGSTLSNVSGHNAFSDTRYTEMANNIDYLTIWFGYNDNVYATLGTIDSDDDSTFYGAWNKVLPYLINKYPTTKIGLIVPYGVGSDWRNAVKDMGKKWGLQVFDMYAEDTPLFYDKDYTVQSSILTARRATFLADGTHPNQTGYNYLSTSFEHWLLSM